MDEKNPNKIGRKKRYRKEKKRKRRKRNSHSLVSNQRISNEWKLFFLLELKNLTLNLWQYSQPVWLQTILQSYSQQDSMVLARRQKYRSMEQNRNPRDESMHLWTRYLWHLILYNGGKTTSLTSSAGKIGQPLVKEWN